MNLEVLKRRRHVPKAGDVFVMKPPDGRYLFGRVISTDASGALGVGCVLLYIYAARSVAKSPVPDLLRGQLLIPPVMTNRLGWVRGYFEHIENQPMRAMDRLRQHCFIDSRGWYFDENGTRLAGPTAPVGCWGFDSFRTIDDKISDALGIPLAPD
jgi:hypothetical protein